MTTQSMLTQFSPPLYPRSHVHRPEQQRPAQKTVQTTNYTVSVRERVFSLLADAALVYTSTPRAHVEESCTVKSEIYRYLGYYCKMTCIAKNGFIGKILSERGPSARKTLAAMGSPSRISISISVRISSTQGDCSYSSYV